MADRNTKDMLQQESKQLPDIEISEVTIKKLIYMIRGQQVMLDSDLAMLYQVETGNLNKAMKRNLKRFPEEFCFQLTKEEYSNLIFQIGSSSLEKDNSYEHGGRRKLPYVYTEQGIAMLSAVLRSDIAIKVSVRIMQIFVELRRYFVQGTFLIKKVNDLEINQIEERIWRKQHEENTEKRFEEVFDYIAEHKESNQKIFFDGQIYDAFSLLVDLVSRAEKKLILVDNYVDVETLNILAKKKTGVEVAIYTSKKTKLSKVDIENFNKQYPTIKVKYTEAFHDRFLILDDEYAYHIGASIKDAGKKCFGINKIEDARIVKTILQRLEPAMEGANK